MNCPTCSEILRQSRAEALDPWFTLHLLACEDCRRLYDLYGVLEAYLDAKPSVTWEEISEPTEAQAVDWMMAMGPGRASSPDTPN